MHRTSHEDNLAGERSFIKGKSVHNQRIESFWGQMRRHSADFFIKLFKCMVGEDLFDGSNLHKSLLQFCFGAVIKAELELTKQLWNEHRIRRQAGNHIAGKPFLLYNIPERYGARDYKINVDENTIKRLMDRHTTKPNLYDPSVKELCDLLLPNVAIPSTPEESLTLYKQLLNKIKQHDSVNEK